MRFTEFRDLGIEYNKKYIVKYKEKRVIKVKDKRTKIIDGFHHVYPIAISRKQVIIVCPYCGEIHYHGLNNGEYAGPRVPHCIDHKNLRDYHIEYL